MHCRNFKFLELLLTTWKLLQNPFFITHPSADAKVLREKLRKLYFKGRKVDQAEFDEVS